MKLWGLELWRSIRSSFWFLPSLMVLAAVALAVGCLELDHAYAMAGHHPLASLWDTGLDSARGLLSTIAGSMITVAGVTFSVVIVALSLASSQYGPRLLARFMEDTGNQVVLGTFISVFAYCLVVLLSLPGNDDIQSLPKLSILVATALAFSAVGILIYFFHHISTSIQAGGLIQDASKALHLSITATLPDDLDTVDDEWPVSGFSEANGKVFADCPGYVNSFDVDELASLAAQHSVRIMILVHEGAFVMDRCELAWVTPADALTQELQQKIRSKFAVVATREACDDLSLALERLTEIAVRGLSPGINDPYTAMAVILQATVALDEILKRHPGTFPLCDDASSPGVFWRVQSIDDLFHVTLDPIRTYGRNDVRVLVAIVDCLVRLGGIRSAAGPSAPNAALQVDDLLRDQLDNIRSTAQASLALPCDIRRFETAYERGLAKLRT